MSNKNNANVVDDCAKRIAAIKKYITDPKTPIPADGKVCTPADFLAVFQEDIDARAAVESARAQVKSRLVARKATEAQRRVYDKALNGWVTSRFGPEGTETLEFGYPQPKARTKTVATKSAAILKSKATRAARHTMGSVQKAELKGTKTVIISPEEAAAIAAEKRGAGTAAPAPTPAPTAPTPAPAPAPTTAGANGGAHA